MLRTEREEGRKREEKQGRVREESVMKKKGLSASRRGIGEAAQRRLHNTKITFPFASAAPFNLSCPSDGVVRGQLEARKTNVCRAE